MANQLPDGIYLDLDFPTYLAQERLSSSSIDHLLESPSVFWANSWLNPDREDQDTDSTAAKLGRAYHAARLEPEEFERRFIRDLVQEDFENVLKNGTEVGEALAGYGEAKKKAGESVIQQAIRLQQCYAADTTSEGEPPVIWCLERQAWEEANADKEWIPPKDWSDIRRDQERIRMNPEIHQHLTAGLAEVSILWTDPETKIRCKIRPDYLKRHQVTHLKTWDVMSRGKEGNRVIRERFMYDGHYLTGWFYHLGLSSIAPQDLRLRDSEGKAMKAAELPANTQDIIQSHQEGAHHLETWFLYLRRGGVPDVRLREVKYMTLPPGVRENMIGAKKVEFRLTPSALLIKADAEIRHALKSYKECIELYGSDPWFPRDMMGSLEDADCHPNWLDTLRISR